MSIPGLTVIETPSMVVDGVRYVERKETQGCVGCEFTEKIGKCAVPVSIKAEAQSRCSKNWSIYIRAEPTITSTALALKLTMILDRAKRIAGESIRDGAAAVHAAYTGAIRSEFERLLDEMERGV